MRHVQLKAFSRIAFFVLALGVIVGVAGGCASDAQVIQQANRMHGGLKPAVINDEALDGYINAVGGRIVEAAQELAAQGYGPAANHDNSWMFGERMRFHFVNSKALNAFTTGGEHMYIYTELFRQASSEDELAAVMAHEFAHVYGRHVQRGMNRQMTLMAAAVGAGAVGYYAGGRDHGKDYAALAAGGTAIGGQLLNMGYTRRDEAEADEMGFQFYVRAGYDPDKFGDFFQKMIDKGYDKGPAMLSDHPKLSDRVRATRERADRLPPQASQWRRNPVVGLTRFRELQERSERLGRTLPTDKSLGGTQDLLAALPRSCLTPAIQEDQIKAERRIAYAAESQRRQGRAN